MPSKVSSYGSHPLTHLSPSYVAAPKDIIKLFSNDHVEQLPDNTVPEEFK